MNDHKPTTIFRKSFRKPTEKARPNAVQRMSCGNLLFDPKMKEAWRPVTAASGFSVNATLFDGRGWLPDKVMHSDMVRTEYRNRYN